MDSNERIKMMSSGNVTIESLKCSGDLLNNNLQQLMIYVNNIRDITGKVSLHYNLLFYPCTERDIP